LGAEKKRVIFVVLVLLILCGFFLFNKFYFYPHFVVHLQQLPSYTPPKEIGPTNPIRPFGVTISKMRHSTQEENSNRRNTSGIKSDEQRNPFLWEGELKPKKGVIAKPKEQAVTIPRLGMILIGESQKSAILDNTLVHPGDRYSGHVVEDIGPDYVILSGGYGVLKISVPEKSFGDPKVDILEETNPNLLLKPVVSKKK